MGCNSTRKNENIQYVRSCCIRECSFSFPIQSSMRVFMLNWHIYVRPLVQFTRSMEGSDWIRIPLCVLVSNSYPVVQCSCLFRIPFICFRVQFVSLMCFIYVGSEDFVSISYPVVRFSCLFRILFTWLRVQFVLRLCFIFVGSGKIVSNLYPVVRWSWLFRTLFKRFRVQFVTACVFFMWGVESWCQIRIQLCGVRVSFVSFWCGVVFKVVSCFCFIWCEVRKSRVKFVSTRAVFSCSVRIPLVYHLCGVWKVRGKVVSSRVHSCLFRIIHLCFRKCFRVQFVFRLCLIHVWSGSLFWIRVALCLHIRFKFVFSRSSSHIIRKHSARGFQFNLYPVACRVNFVSCSYGFVFFFVSFLLCLFHVWLKWVRAEYVSCRVCS